MPECMSVRKMLDSANRMMSTSNVAQLSIGMVATTASAENGDTGQATPGYGKAALTVIGHDFLPGIQVVPMIGNAISGVQFITGVFGNNGLMQTYSNCLNQS